MVNPNALWANRVGFESSLTKLWIERWLPDESGQAAGLWQCACK